MHIQNNMPMFSISDIWDTVSAAGSEISDIFSNTGSWVVPSLSTRHFPCIRILSM